MNILIVDDKQENRYLLESLLKGDNYHTFSAANGKAALDILYKKTIDLIISDILMPEMDGFQLCRIVKASEKYCHIPLIFYTATYTTRQDEIFALRLGAAKFIRKPLDPVEFIAIIKEVLQIPKTGAQKAGIPKYKDQEEVLEVYNKLLIEKLEHKIQELGASESRYRAIFESTGTATLIVNEDTTITMANHEFANITGYNPNELIGRKWTEFVAPESLALILKYHQLRRQKPGQAPKKYEVKLINKAGQIRHALLDIGMIPRTSQSVVSILDITELKTTEEALRKSDALLREIQHITKVGGWEYDVPTKQISWTDEVYRIYGVSRKTYDPNRIGQDIAFYAPEDQKTIEQAFQGAVTKGKSYDLELQFVTAEGKQLWVHTSGKPILKNNKVVRVVGYFADITQRKQAEEKIIEQHKFQQLRAELWKIATKPVATENELIQKILEKIGGALDVSRATFLRLNQTRKAYLVENQWYTPQAGPSENHSISFPKAKLLFGRRFAVLPDNLVPGLKQYVTRKFKRDHIYSYIAVPYGNLKNPEGIFTFSECRQMRQWSQMEIDTLLEIINITTLKSEEIRTQRAIRESESRLKEAQALGKIGSWYFDLASQQIHWSDQTYVLYKRNPKLGPPTPDEEANYYSPKQAQILREYTRLAIDEGKSFEYDLKAHWSSGETTWFAATMKPVKDDQDKVIRLQGTVQDITERKLAEEKFKIIFESAPDAYYLSDLKGIFTDGNLAAERLTGYRRDELIGKSFLTLNLLPKHHLPKAATLLAKNALGKSTGPDEFTLLQKDGGEVEVEIATHPVKIEGKPVVLGIARDISERKQMELALIESKERFSTFMETLPITAFIKDRDHRFLYINREMKRVFNAEDWIGKSLSDVFPPDIAQALTQADEKSLQKGTNVETHVVPDKNGVERIWETHTFRIDHKAQEPLLGGFSLDITERKAAESKLQLRLKLEELVSKISNQFINIDIAAIDSAINKALQTIAEFTELDRSYIFLFAENGTKMDNTHEWCAEGIESQRAKFQDLPADMFPLWLKKLKASENIYIPDTTRLPPEVSAEKTVFTERNARSAVIVPIIYSESLIGFLELDRINREMKWDQEDINLFRTIGDIFANALQHQREEKSKRDIQHQLLQAQKLESIGTLAGGVAHDFNNLLTVIQGNAQLAMMSMEESDPNYREMREIMNASLRAAKLTRQLLLFSRKQPMEFVPLNINSTIENLLKMLGRLIGEDIEIHTQLVPELWQIYGDEGNLEQVITNIAVNARDAMPKGGTLFIRTGNVVLDTESVQNIPDAQPGNYILLEIEDSGGGISPQVLEKIFEPFFTTKAKGRGTGLGLSVVYGIVKEHGGWINVYSEVNQGTIFKIYLPATLSKQTWSRPEISKPGAELTGHGETILFVEDEPSLLELSVLNLQKYGYTVLSASNPIIALELFREQKAQIQLVISDVIMPQMSGIELAKKLQESKPSLKIILSSGYTEERSQYETIQSRGYSFIQKPYPMERLLELVKKVIAD